MNAKRSIALISITLVLLVAFTASAFSAEGEEPGETTAGNNLSFPVIAVDDFPIVEVPKPFLFDTPYLYDETAFTGLTTDEIVTLLGPELQAEDPDYSSGCSYGLGVYGCWYPQKTEGNVWQADFVSVSQEELVKVSYVDWSDNIESINPKVRRPFRLEVVLFKELDDPMTAYNMAVLENPSSPDELQGTNKKTYESSLATVISTQPKLVVQHLEGFDPASLTWGGASWAAGDNTPEIIPVSFAPELNVGGKYIFGASEGGWKPTQEGWYRITFYVPNGSGVNLTEALVGGLPSTSVATALVDWTNNLTYVDVEVVAGGGGGGGGKGRP